MRVRFSGGGRNGITIVDTANEMIVATCRDATEAASWLRQQGMSWVPGSRGLWRRQ